MTELFVGDRPPGSTTDPPTSPALAARPDDLPDEEPVEQPVDRRDEPGATSSDLLSPFSPAIMAVRWATTGVSLALSSPYLLDGARALLAWTSLILINTVFRTARPLRYTGSVRSMAQLFAEIGLHVLAVVATGYWDSPLVLVLINAVIIAGFARGFGFALRVGAASTLAVTAPGLGTADWPGPGLAQSAQWATLIGLSGIVAGYSRRISGEATRRHTLALDRVARLADANALLADLHRVTQTLPASLDQGEVMETTLSRLRALLAHDTVVILTREPSGRWRVAKQAGAGVNGELALEQLPADTRRAISQVQPVRTSLEAGSGTGPGFSPRSVSALYLPLLARDRLIGLLAVESATADAFTDREQRLLEGFVEPVALSIDNARWFNRIRTVGADEERNRIARDLHDRIGQSLAYLGFEVDRVIRRYHGGDDVTQSLHGLRTNLRALVSEVRDTLSDLRTDVSDTRDFDQTARELVERVRARSDLKVELHCQTVRRLPILQEREMWRIAQEALANVERHAQASTVRVCWRSDEHGALLEVTDDGRGLPPRSADGNIGRPDSYGIVGMRERADSVGATFEMTSQPGEGTKVRCFLAQR
jgi:signal transduction histidine kinase